MEKVALLYQPSIPPAVPPGSGPLELLPIQAAETLPSFSMRLSLPDLALRALAKINTSRCIVG